MKSRDFCYWLQGFFELVEHKDDLTKDQVRVVRNHLALVFKHEIDPSNDGGSMSKAVELKTIHDGRSALSMLPTSMGRDVLINC